MLSGGAKWALGRGWGQEADLARIEEHGQMLHAKPGFVSEQAKRRQRDEMGTLGSGNHYLEVQEVTQVFDDAIAESYGLKLGDVVVMIHCGSRGLGHQIGTEFLSRMVAAAPGFGLTLPDRELACAPIHSDLGKEYLGAMRAAINCASACHGAGRAMSRHAATKNWQGREVINELAGRGILIRSPSMRGVAEEAPGAYKDVTAVVNAAQAAGLAHKVARLAPLICVKG